MYTSHLFRESTRIIKDDYADDIIIIEHGKRMVWYRGSEVLLKRKRDVGNNWMEYNGTNGSNGNGRRKGTKLIAARSISTVS